ncbi:TetR/AcrR family transcriptional regulator [Paenibacillus faecalis]|uniref:TetR/AcrR family transcriptional regulator n=1 Tax=Paenibacillus faecalis TaxID=2079532 RepID=UPI000D10C1CF|nr:TetR/AcrR family transcriptional regulator [Paenibacillus faecalis]
MLREARKKETKELIFLQAIKLFKEKGYDHVTVQEIASSCGIAKGTFFNYFSKKEEILLYLGESQLELMHQSMKEHQELEQHPREYIGRVLHDLLLRFTENGELIKLAIFELIRSAYLVEKESKSVLQLKQSLASMIDRAKKSGKLHTTRDANVIASTIVGVYFHTMLSWSLLHSGDKRIDEILEEQLDVVWEGINHV